jgi:hypothetical protein
MIARPACRPLAWLVRDITVVVATALGIKLANWLRAHWRAAH